MTLPAPLTNERGCCSIGGHEKRARAVEHTTRDLFVHDAASRQ
jgi:hypothetical protein